MSDTAPATENRSWLTYMTRYHWYVFTLAALGWLFDTMDGMIFTASRSITMADLMKDSPPDEQRVYGGIVTSLFILGWATGGLIFGVVGDRWGRAKTMALTIFIYAAFTGLSGLSQNWWQFGILRFLTGLGVGGEFAAGAALLSEVMPEQARAKTLGWLQGLSAVGNITGAVLFWYIEPVWGWKALYLIGAFPALLSVVVRAGLKEPEKWQAAKAAAAAAPATGQSNQMGGIGQLFGAQLRRNTMVGLCLGISGVLGLWGAGFFSPELMDASIPILSAEARPKFEAIASAKTPEEQLAAIGKLTEDKDKKIMEVSTYKEIVSRRFTATMSINPDAALTTPLSAEQSAQLRILIDKSMPKNEHTSLKAKGLVLQQIGAFFGIMCYAALAARMGRRPAFLAAFVIAWFSVVYTFLFFDKPSQVWYMYPLLGFGTLAPFGGYALYFPELFPTRLRTTGTGFCYNVGRYVSSIGPFALPVFAAKLHGTTSFAGFRMAAVVISMAYIIGIVALIWAPETKDQPLPEDEKSFVH
ncbi:MAG TPA: MFS transporter [Planctomycetota bacterium]|nr:MFS transporter [Planctomycetota bacterium]